MLSITSITPPVHERAFTAHLPQKHVQSRKRRRLVTTLGLFLACPAMIYIPTMYEGSGQKRGAIYSVRKQGAQKIANASRRQLYRKRPYSIS
ncbi:hypothetical protein B0T14DRAFT_523813 [Immersiella caudata]|uniref:Uncharacterized protein n=1 Tax=Immersiella caudata TaxID=314043 RepID=A0AA39WJX1_9PEZI|nr:hypothetical protein B0T14DRAFT_523813 [Immersiella caudata]